ncbi:hypothetical protein PPYR_07194 [Photinus pyralis]|uniref:Uncharacterized protein n=1 Tax=Photinus pyralis TaxID=7054 RepID=A0A5N4APR8_PHOPY|nr:hypothetical protein PPYR_07194 [Photinus pyralis]
MKPLLVACILFIVHQVSSDADIATMITRITESCAERNGVLSNQMNEHMSKDELPEDNGPFIQFYECLMSDLGMYDENGEVHFERVPNNKPVYIVERLGDDISTTLILEAFDHCNSQVKVSPRALDAIKRRNCGLKYIKNKLKKSN